MTKKKPEVPLLPLLLRLLRISRGVSQSDIAAELGITSNAVNQYERGGTPIREGSFIGAVRVLGFTEEEAIVEGLRLRAIYEKAGGGEAGEAAVRALAPARAEAAPAPVRRAPVARKRTAPPRPVPPKVKPAKRTRIAR